MAIRVYFPKGNLPLYESISARPPEGIEYLEVGRSDPIKYYSRRMDKIRGIVSTVSRILKIPRTAYFPSPPGTDVIHSNRGILVLNRVPWVMDLDNVFAFTSYEHLLLRSYQIRRIITRFLSSKYFGKLLHWSLAAKKSFHSALSGMPGFDSIVAKEGILYPAGEDLSHIREKHDGIVVFYAGGLFRPKGALEALEVAWQLVDKYDDVFFIIKADVPPVYARHYCHQRIQIVPYKGELLPHDEYLRNYFARADIFLYPTMSDIFGLGLIDALSVGIPIVATRYYAVPEVVKDGINGFLIDVPEKYLDYDPVTYLSKYFHTGRGMVWPDHPIQEIVSELVDRLSALIEDSSLRRKMGRASLRLVQGYEKFSIKRRNKILREAYESALRS